MSTTKGMTIATRYSGAFIIIAAYVLASTVTATSEAPAVPQQQLNTVSYYGRLGLHPNYFNHPDATSPLWRVQGGEVVLSNAHHTLRAPTHTDGSFVLYDVPYGTYQLHGEYAHFVYPTVRVDVTQKTTHGIAAPIIRTYANDASMTPVQGSGLDESSPAIIPFVGVHEYYTPREHYSVFDFFKNPMIIMMLVSMGLVGIMRLMPEEDRKDSMREMQRLRKQFAGEPTDGANTPSVTAGGREKKSK
ncbi:C15orf24 protein [Trypanosoma grayi]|uniref:C15orf24 protein n=1 Tax=Trypanosoma grayi TaxID=71804 RepID=UPI0004F49868|nr:C15orf24 protein [Trypanosoma grayi]KEG08582.1 C15orf24 protein [Trypanosoma grayi]